MPRSRKNGERIEEVGKDKKEPTRVEALRPKSEQPDKLYNDLAKFPSENPYPVLRIHRDGTVLYANKASEPLLKARGSGMGQPAPAEWRRVVEEVLKSGRVAREEVKDDGRVFALRAVPIADSDYVNFYGTDITEQKKAEERVKAERQRLYDVLETLPVMVCLLTPDYHVAFTNRVFRQKFGEDNGRHCYDYIFGQKGPCEFCETYNVLKTGKPHHWECTGPDGCSIIDVYDFPFTDTDGTPLILEMDIDITEQKRAEENLKAREEFLDNIIEQTPNSIWISDEHGTVIRMNQAIRELLQLTNEEITGKYNVLKDVQVIEQGFLPLVKSVFEEGKTVNFVIDYYTEKERQVELAHKTHKVLDITISAIKNKDGKVVNAICQHKDITERKQAEQALKKSNQLLRDTGEMAKVGGWELDLSTKEVFCTEEVGRIHGLEPGHKLSLEEALNFYAPESRPALEAVLKKAAETGEPYDLESLFIPSGSKDKIWVRSLGRAVYSGGKIVKLAGTFQNIDKYKRAEEALRDASRHWQTTFDTINDSICILDKENRILRCNAAMANLVGKPQSETQGQNCCELIHGSPIYLKDCPLLCAKVSHRRESKELQLGDLWFNIMVDPILSEAGEFLGAVHIVGNITERKRAEEALRESEDKFKTLADESFDSIVIHDGEKIVEVNKASGRLWGYNPGEAAGLKVDVFFAPECWGDVKKRIQAGYDKPYETVAIRQDGTRFHVEIAGKSITYKGKTVRIATARDITERKRAEEELRKEKDFAKSLVETAQAIVLVLDTRGCIVSFNPYMEEISGYNLEEVLGFDWFSTFVPKRDRERIRELFEKATVDIQTHGDVNSIVTKNGEEREIEWYDKTLKDNSGNIIGLLATGQDITERKRAEERLQEERNLLRTLIDHIPDGVYVKDKDSRFVALNNAVTEYWDTKGQGDVIGKTDFDFFDKDKAQRLFDEEQEIIRTGQPIINLERPCTSKTGKTSWVLTTKVPLRDSHGNITGIVGINHSITERKMAEIKLLEYQKQLKRLAAQLSLAEERERRRIAGELHDQVGQSLALAKIKLDALRASATSRPAEEVLADVSETMQRLIGQTRSLTFDLSSPILYELGFEAAVSEWLNEEVRDKHGIATEFSDDGQTKPLDDDVRVLLFRNVRELLINCIKHANADKVRVGIRRIDDSIEVTVEDNGVGFDPAEVGALSGKRVEFGLLSIRESLEELGGRFEIESKPGAGCKAVMTAPLKRKGIDDERNKATHQGNGN